MDLLEYYKELWARLPKDVSANLEFAGLVANNEKYNVDYFFREFSVPIVKWIAIQIYSHKSVDDITPFIMSDYFSFVVAPIDENGKFHWYQLTSYKGLSDQKLKSWLMQNALRYFAKKRQKQIKQQNSETELLEFVDYKTLLMIDENVPDVSDEELIYRHRLQRAWDSLTEKDKVVLQLLLIDKLNWADAFDELKVYMKPKDGPDAMERWTIKQKRGALYCLKNRAIKHLIAKFNKEKTVNNG